MAIGVQLEKFKGQVKDIARPNRFAVTINDPPGGMATWQEEPIGFTVKTFSLPAREIGEIIVNFQGMQTKIAGDPTYPDVTMTLHNEYDWGVKDFFESWLEGISLTETEGTNTRSAPADYKTTIKVEQLGRDGDTLATYVLVGAFPKTMDAIELSHESTDSIEELSISFGYDYFFRE
jgi:hypothetical protein